MNRRAACLILLSVATSCATPAIGDDFDVLARFEKWVGGLAISADGDQFAVAVADGTARLFDWQRCEEIARFEAHRDVVKAVAISPDGRTLATGSFDQEARLWDVDSKRTNHRLIGHRGAVLCVAFSADGKQLATGSIDGTIKLWGASNGALRCTLTGHQSWVNSVAFNADGTLLASGSSDGTIRLWDVEKARLKTTVRATKAEVRSIALAPDGRTLAAGIRYGEVQVWDLEPMKIRWRVSGHKSDVWSVTFDPDGKTLISGNGDWNEPGEVKFWETASGRHTGTLRHTGEVLCVALSPSGRYLVVAAGDKTVGMFDIVEPARLMTAAGPDDWIKPMRQVHAKFKGTPGTFAQFGDSITVTMAYWAPLAGEPKNLSDEGTRALKRVKSHMKPQCWREWKGGKYGSDGGMTIRWAHENIDKWLKEHNPETALIMFGTNDIGQVPLDEYERKLGEVVDRCLANGTVTIVSTIPPRSGHLDDSRKFADAARKVARAKNVPLVDYQAEILRRRPDDWDGSLAKFKGQFKDVYDAPTLVSGDGVHPSNPKTHRDYSEESRRTNGYALRSYLTLLAYARVIDKALGRN